MCMNTHHGMNSKETGFIRPVAFDLASFEAIDVHISSSLESTSGPAISACCQPAILFLACCFPLTRFNHCCSTENFFYIDEVFQNLVFLSLSHKLGRKSIALSSLLSDLSLTLVFAIFSFVVFQTSS